jgi:hypothetical protein
MEDLSKPGCGEEQLPWQEQVEEQRQVQDQLAHISQKRQIWGNRRRDEVC